MDDPLALVLCDSESESEDVIFYCCSCVGLAMSGYSSQFNKTPIHTSILSGQQWLAKLFSGHDIRFHNELGMNKFVFRRLVTTLETDAGLYGTRHVTSAEQVAIFLHYSCRGLSNRALQERFQRSGDTIRKCIYRLLHILTSREVFCSYVRLPTQDAPIPAKIQASTRFSQYFSGCIGALDGSHVPAHVPEGQRIPYRNCKNQLSKNVLAACDFDLRFLYVLPGWEGSAADSRVYENATANDFHIPQGRFYLGDAGYANSTSLLVPYRSTRYHLKEWGQGKHRPQNYRELFNYRHSQLRNAIERIFGIFKRRFRVLMLAPEYPLDMQAQLVSALAVLHNFIRIHDPTDLLEDDNAQDHAHGNVADEDQHHRGADFHDTAASFRDGIALKMWQDYQENGHRRA